MTNAYTQLTPLFFLLLTPLVAALAAFVLRWLAPATHRLVATLHLVSVTALLALALVVVGQVLAEGPQGLAGHWFYVDGLGAVFLALVGVIGFITGLYSVGYMRHELAHGEVTPATLCSYYGFFNLFLFTMLLVVTANNLIMMWVAIEATTLGSAFLVGLYGQRSSLEAAWKYIVICSVGVAFGLYGTVLVFSNAAAVMAQPEGAAFWTVVMQSAHQLDPTLMRLSFVFVLIGFGTKAGLFPMHAWLPDAHSEAPSPVSALLSAVLLNCALLVIIRYAMLVGRSVGPAFPQTLLLVFGLMSIAVAAFFIIVQRDMKRLLAYSSVENMGLIAVALGVGGPLGVLAALFHTINHSLAKALLFCGSGNVLLKYGTRDLDAVKGLLRVAPASGVLLAAGALALGGLPPFNVFVSEFMVVTAGIAAGHGWLMALTLLLLTVVLGGLVRMVAGAVLGASPDAVQKGEPGLLTVLPMALLLAAMFTLGVYMPQPVKQLVSHAAGIVLDSGDTALAGQLRMPWEHQAVQAAPIAPATTAQTQTTAASATAGNAPAAGI